MPKASSTSTTARSRKASPFVFIHNNKRVLATRKTCYYEAILECRKLFSAISANHDITFHTKELPICAGSLTEISEGVWDEVIGNLTSVTVITEERQNRPREMLGVVASNQDIHKEKPLGTIELTIFNLDNEKLMVRSRSDHKMEKIFGAVENTWGGVRDDWRLIFGSRRCPEDATIEEMGIKDGDVLYLNKKLVGGKPVIYLFSPKTLEADVKLSLIPQWNLCAIYPVVPVKPRTVRSNEQVAWRVRTHANGDLTELTTGLDITYLFWEAHTNATVPPSPPASPLLGESSQGLLEHFNPNEAVLNDENSVVMPVAIITPYLDKALTALGLHTEARTSFITLVQSNPS